MYIILLVLARERETNNMDTFWIIQALYVDKTKYLEYNCDECCEVFYQYFDDNIYKVFRSNETLYFCNAYHCFHNYTYDKNVKFMVTQ